MKFLRTIRFDGSDDRIFERAAAADEWAIPGGLLYAGLDPDSLEGKLRQAFANGFFAPASRGHATLTVVAETDPAALQTLTDALAEFLSEVPGAPGPAAAAEAARREVAFTADLCAELPVNTLLAVSRSHDEDGQVRERFRTIAAPTDPVHARVWDVEEDTLDGA